MKRSTVIVVLLGLTMGWIAGYAQTTTTIKGVMFADYYYNVENHSKSVKDQNAFNIRRVYFTFENNLTKDIKTRIRFESAHNGFGSGSKINPFVKHAYLEWSNLIPSHKLYLGISETNGLKNAENVWGYRSIEKTILDLNKISASADMGSAIKGDLGAKVHHWLTVMNGTGYGSSEVDKFKKVGYAFWVTPVEELILEAYADYEAQDPEKPNFQYDYYGSSGYYTLKGFAGWKTPKFSLGVEAFMRTNRESGTLNMDDAASKVDVIRQGLSVFGSWITPVPKVKLFARYDSFDPVTDDKVIISDSGTTGLDDETTLLIAGFDYIPSANIHFMPNIVLKSYSKSGKDSDLTARITFYYNFSSGKIIVQ